MDFLNYQDDINIADESKLSNLEFIQTFLQYHDFNLIEEVTPDDCFPDYIYQHSIQEHFYIHIYEQEIDVILDNEKGKFISISQNYYELLGVFKQHTNFLNPVNLDFNFSHLELIRVVQAIDSYLEGLEPKSRFKYYPATSEIYTLKNMIKKINTHLEKLNNTAGEKSFNP